MRLFFRHNKLSCLAAVLGVFIAWDLSLGHVSRWFGNPSAKFYLSYLELAYLHYLEADNVNNLKKRADYYAIWKLDSGSYYIYIQKLANIGDPNSQYIMGRREILNGDPKIGIQLIEKSARQGYSGACFFIKRRGDLKISEPKECLKIK